MRLIDADEFEKRIKPYDTEDNMDKALYNFAHYHLITTPSAQPTQSNDSNTLNALDCISRQAAIGAHCELCPDNGKYNCDICPDVEAFQLLPSAQPEIIRCGGCRWFGKIDDRFYRKNTCTNPRVGMKAGENDFCSYAEAGEAGE